MSNGYSNSARCRSSLIYQLKFGRKWGKLLATTYNNRIVIDRKQYAQCQIEHADDHGDDDPDVQEHIYVAHILVPCICKGDFGVRSDGPWFGALFPEQRRAYL